MKEKANNVQSNIAGFKLSIIAIKVILLCFVLALEEDILFCAYQVNN